MRRRRLSMSEPYLRRYTDIPALIYLLQEKRITLLNPQSWDDGNDSHYLSLYREKKRLASVLALCFTQGAETYHHWRVFANGSSGVCVQFRREELLNAIKSLPGVRQGKVIYLKLKELQPKKHTVPEPPVLNR